MSIRVILGCLFLISIIIAAPGDSTLNENFSSSLYPQWPDGWHRFSFETANTNFWQLSTQQPHSSPYCLKCEGSNVVRNNDWIITRMVYPTLGDTIFSFWYEAHNRSVNESLEVWVSTTNPDTTGMTVRLDAFRFNNNSYEERIVNLSDYINTPIYLGIYYPPFNRLGARIDDVTGPHYPPLDVSPISIIAPSSDFLLPGSFTPSAIIKNYGSTSPASFSVACTLYNIFGIPIYSDVQNVSPFLPNTTSSTNFNATPILPRGEYTLAVRTLLVGDAQIINNRKARTITVIQGTEKFYDNGIVTEAVYASLAGEGYGVKFTPASYPKIIQGAEVMLSHQFYPPQPSNSIFRIRVIDDDGLQGAPRTILWESNDIYGNRGDWNYIPFNQIPITSGSYYLFWIQAENYTQCAGIGADDVLNSPNSTQYRFSGGTYSQNGLPNGDLMIRSCESELITDAGVTAIIAPTGTIDSGQVVIPQARIKNFGNIPLTNIPVRFTISAWQHDTVIAGLTPNESTTVAFAQWTAAPGGNINLQCSTHLTGDMNPGNDPQADSLFVRVLDVQTISITNPPGSETLDQGDTLNPQATITNLGNTSVTFNAQFKISDGYSDDTTITLGAGTQTDVDFAIWVADTSGNFMSKCTTRLNGDMRPVNDKFTDSVFVQYLDVQTISITKPAGDYYFGDTATPQAKVCNNGTIAQTFPVKFTLSDGYSDTITVNNLAPSETTMVRFKLWTANTAGTFQTRCTTQLTGDMNPANDQQTGSVFVRFLDVGTTAILSPPAFVDSGFTFIPQARIKNFGNTSLTSIPVRFKIGSWQDDTIVTGLAPNESTLVSFAPWSASPLGPLMPKCSTMLTADMNKTNDRQTGLIFVRLPDYQSISIIQPTGTINQGDTMTPQAIVRNNGNVIITSPVRFEISDGYSNTTTVTVNQGAQTTVSFALWTANTPGSLATKCTTRLLNDVYQTNDKITGSVFVQYLDVQTVTIIKPTGNFSPGDTVTPRATVRNNGNTAQTFQVRYSITDGYSDVKTINNLAPGSTTAVNFNLWTANTPGTFVTKCSTQLAGDKNPANDKQTGSVFVGFTDVGTVALLSLPAIVDSGLTFTPQAIIKNYGPTTVFNVPARFTIGTWQRDTTIASLASNESTIVSFNPWTATPRGNLVVKCSTRLFGDINPANDKQTGSVFVRVYDVQTISIVRPTSSVSLGDTVTPQAIVRNNGNISVTFPVRFYITDGYVDEITTTINPDTQITVNFALWTANTVGNLVTKCSTKLTNDMNKTNDEQTGSVFVGIVDVGTTAIIAPSALIDSGQTVAPQARIKNFGNTTVNNIPVRFIINTWQDNKIVSSLAPNESTIVTFANWTATLRGNLAMKCSTLLAQDINHTNDQQTSSVFVRVLDVQTISILKPTGSLDPGDTITPQATIANNGNTSVTFPVKFVITDGYSDDTTITLNPGIQTSVNFVLWTANTSGNFTTKCTTQLTNDMNNLNDKQTGLVSVGFIDVGTCVILSPPALVDSGQTIIPQAMIKNYGTSIATNIPVRFTIGTWQNDTVISSLAPNESTLVSFAAWTATPRGNLVVKCSTRLFGDINPANDKQTGSVFVRVYDVQTISIVRPTSSVSLGDTVTPQAIVRNNGNISVTFPVRFYITDGYVDEITTNISPDTQITVNFNLWTAITAGSFVTKCSTKLTNDMNKINDKQTGSVFVGVIDVGTTTILAPPSMVDSGQIIAPQTIVKNFGNTTVNNIPVRFTINTWQDNKIIPSLAPNESTIVTFNNWFAYPRGNLAMKCSTLLAGDVNHANDLQTGSVFVRVLDVQTFSITNPPSAETLNQGDTLTPQATISNNGNTTVTFQIRFEISNGYLDDTTMTLNAGNQTLLNFALWTANAAGTFSTKCSTRLTDDMNKSNDKKSGSVFVRFFDVQTMSIIKPTGTHVLGDTATPQAIIKNNSNTSVTFPVRFEIADGYSDEKILTLLPIEQTTVNFALWTADTIGNFTTKCSTRLADDMNETNDKQTGSVLVGFIDVGVTAITAPPLIVDSGQTITPQARVKNFGSQSVNNIPVRFTIGTWQDDTVINSLTPDESTTVSFTPWTASQRGNFGVKCSTRLARDYNPSNDRQTNTVLVAVSDIATIAILAPPTIVDSGLVINPVAKVKNLGNVVLNDVPIRFTISTWQHDTLIPSLAPDESTLVIFVEWNVMRRGNWVMKCSTRLNNDMNKRNDKIQSSIFVRVLDVAASDIVAPADSIIKDIVFTPRARTRNYGNTQVNINCYFAIVREPDTLYQKTINLTINPNQELEVIFPDTLLDSTGIYTAGFFTELTGDMHPENNLIEDNFRVYVPIPPIDRIWIRMADIPITPSGKPPKSSSGMAGLEATGKIYYLKASNTQDFCIYEPDTGRFAAGNWTSDTLPLGSRDSFDGKKPKKGTSITAFEPGKSIYVLRGSNSRGFWKYQADTLDTMSIGWKKMKEIPLGIRAPRDGSGMVAVNKAGEDYIFTMKGSRTSEFYLYDIANNSWTGVTSPPVGLSGKMGYKKGSCLTYDDNGFVYALKGNYGDFFKYSIEGDSWYELRRYDYKVFRNRYGLKKKIKDGSAIAYHDNNIYLLKGSNTYEFWMYSIAGDTWIQLDVNWDIPTGIGKKVKGGGALIKFGNHFYATKGNRTSEFYRHLLPNGTITLASNPPLLDGAMANRITNNEFKIMITPNPAQNHALVKYNLMKKGSVNLKLYNISGGLVKSYTCPNDVKDGIIRIETKGLAAGIYILRFNSAEVGATRKLVIQK